MTFNNAGLLIVLTLCLCIQHTFAQVLHEYDRLTPDPSNGSQVFGRQIDSTEDYVIVAAPGYLRKDGGNGIVNVFDAKTNQHLYGIVPNDPLLERSFGNAVSISGNHVAIVSKYPIQGHIYQNMVSIFDLSSRKLVNKIQLEIGVDASGPAAPTIAMWDHYLAVGSPFDDELGARTGAVYVYNTLTGELIHKIFPRIPSFGGEFGNRVVAHNGVLAVDSPLGVGLHLACFVYLYDFKTGEEIALIPSLDNDEGRESVNSIALNDQYVAIASWVERAIWLFDRKTGEEVAEINTDDGYNGDDHNGYHDSFGLTIQMDDQHLLVSAITDHLNNFNSGAAYVFDLDTHTQLAKIVPTVGDYGVSFGYPSSIVNGQAYIAEWLNDEFGRNAGMVYHFDVTTLHQCSPDFDDNGVLNIADIQLFINLYMNQDPSTDFTIDLQWDYYDISEFMQAYSSGCP